MKTVSQIIAQRRRIIALATELNCRDYGYEDYRVRNFGRQAARLRYTLEACVRMSKAA